MSWDESHDVAELMRTLQQRDARVQRKQSPVLETLRGTRAQANRKAGNFLMAS